MALKKRSGVGCWCGTVVAMDSSRRSERQQFKSITVLRHTVFLGSKPKENGVLGLPGSPNATCERRWVGRFWTVTHEVLGNPEVGSRVNATACDAPPDRI